MNRWLVAAALLLFTTAASARNRPSTQAPAKSVTVPATIDHNRVVIDVDLPVPGASSQRVHAWVDNGNADFEMSRRLATLLGLSVRCSDHECSSPPPQELLIGGMSVSLAGIQEAHIPLKPVSAAAVLEPGMNVEINLPATVLHNYDVLVDFPEHRFSIGPPGSIHFQGSRAKVHLDAATGLIQIPSQIENKKYNLALDLGASISFLAKNLFDRLAAAHADWPRMSGAVGSANMWGLEDETKWNVMRVERVQYGSLFLTNVPFVNFPKDRMEFFEKRAGMPTAGLLGAEALLNYRVGLDYAHSMVYFDIGRMFIFPDFDVVGLILRPEDDGRFAVLGVADFAGQPSVPAGEMGVQPGDHLVAVDGIPVRGSTMGQVWSMLGGTSGQERRLSLERGGKQLTIGATVRHFLAEAPDVGEKKKH